MSFYKEKLNRLTLALLNFQELRRTIKRVLAWHMYLPICKMIMRPRTLVMNKDWDNLIILDACRFDAFTMVNWIPGKLAKIISAGTTTWEWFIKNFKNVRSNEIVYISTNPFISEYNIRKYLGFMPFYKIVEVWKFGWNEKLNTVHPSTVNIATRIAMKRYTNKKFIIHYMQPHYPFIGRVKLVNEEYVFNRLRRGELSVNLAWIAYLYNLKYVLKYVEKLIPYLRGTVCITSDHGNAFGELGVFYGHTANTPLPELIEVPWLEIE